MIAQLPSLPSPADAVPENRHMTSRLTQIVALRKAADFLGQAKLALALEVADRTMRAYLGADRTIPVAVLDGAANALDQRAAAMMLQATELRAIADACRKTGT